MTFTATAPAFGPRTRLAIDLVVLVVYAAVMLSQNAPGWSITLLLYIATRQSRIDQAAELAALQATIRLRLEPAPAEPKLEPKP